MECFSRLVLDYRKQRVPTGVELLNMLLFSDSCIKGGFPCVMLLLAASVSVWRDETPDSQFTYVSLRPK